MLPRVILHYRVVRRLGAGGMGEIYLAQDTRVDRPVALKVMSAELGKDAAQRRRFRTEAKAAAGLLHPHICAILEVGETEGGRPFLAMEYIDGQTLDKVLAHYRFKLPEIIELAIGVAEALEAAHAQGLLHRDIKPGNLMLDRHGSVKVLDFGLAKRLPTEELTGSGTSVVHTRTGMLLGTPQYMSPEQALGHALDPRTDIFSLGAVLYELVAGQRPFLGQTLGETINEIVNQPLEPLEVDRPLHSPALNAIIFKCLEKDRNKRYTSATELCGALRKLRSDSEHQPDAATPQEIPAPLTTAEDQRHTVLWKLLASAGRGRKAARARPFRAVVSPLVALANWAHLRKGNPSPGTAGNSTDAAIDRSPARNPARK